MRLVDAQDLDAAVNHIDLVNTARMLRKAPIAGQRHIEQLEQESTIHAVVPDQNDGLAGVPHQNEPQCVRCSRHEVLE